MFEIHSIQRVKSTDAQHFKRILVWFSLNSAILLQARDRSWIEDSYQDNCHVLSHLIRKGSKDDIAVWEVNVMCSAILKLIEWIFVYNNFRLFWNQTSFVDNSLYLRDKKISNFFVTFHAIDIVEERQFCLLSFIFWPQLQISSNNIFQVSLFFHVKFLIECLAQLHLHVHGN